MSITWAQSTSRARQIPPLSLFLSLPLFPLVARSMFARNNALGYFLGPRGDSAEAEEERVRSESGKELGSEKEVG